MKVTEPVGATPPPGVSTSPVRVVVCPWAMVEIAELTATAVDALTTVNATVDGVLDDLL
jgi:hypothetical protein